MEILRTPEERFEKLPGYDFEPHYLEISGLRVHYLDEGPADAAPVLLLHGEPSWCYLYRKLIPVLTAAGHRAVAPGCIGSGGAAVLAGGAGAADRPDREARLRLGPAGGGGRGLRRAVSGGALQGGRAGVPVAGADAARRSGFRGQPEGVGGAEPLGEAVPHGVQRQSEE